MIRKALGLFILMLFTISILTACKPCEDNAPSMVVRDCEKKYGTGTQETAECIKENYKTPGQILGTDDKPNECYLWYIDKYHLQEVDALDTIDILPETGISTLEPVDVDIAPITQ